MIISRILLLVLALSVHVAQAALQLQENGNAISDYVFFCIMSAIILLNIVVELLHQLTGTNTSAVQFFFWMSQVLCCVPALKQNIDNLTSNSQLLSSSLSTVFIVLNIVLLITQWFLNWKTEHPSEDETPFPSWLTFSWMSNCFSKGYKSDQLGLEDLPSVNFRIDINHVLQTFLDNLDSKTKVIKRSSLEVLIKLIWRQHLHTSPFLWP